MKKNQEWRERGWRDPLWDYVRFDTVVRGQKKELRERWIKNLQDSKLEIVSGQYIPIDPADARRFFNYLDARDKDFERASELLRSEEESLAFCKKMRVEAGTNATQLEGYYRSSKLLIAGVTAVANLVCSEKGVTFVPSPQRRCAWLIEN